MPDWGPLQREQTKFYRSTMRVPGRPQYGHLPIVTVFAGRRWVLDDDAQSMAFTVSNRSTYRHDVGARAYARYVLLLAARLGTDPTTAGRLARWICPDGCTVIRGGPRVVYVLTAEQEHERTRVRAQRAHDRALHDLRAGTGLYAGGLAAGRTAAQYRAETGRNIDGPYTCRGCRARYVSGNGWNGGPLATPDGVRRSCGPRCAERRDARSN